MDINEVLQSFGNVCRCGKKHTLITDTIRISSDANEKLKADIAKRGFSFGCVIADTNTAKAAGEALSEQLAMPLLTLPGNVHATETVCMMLQKMLAQLPDKPAFYIACGSGSLHDIVRYTACENNLPFYSYPTAASVDGFVSGIAAMTIHGTKVSYPSRSPIALFADPVVIANAPARLTASGVGDLLGKYICLTDWKIAHALTGEAICPALLDLEYEVIRELETVISSFDGQSSQNLRNTEFVTRLMEGLVLSGLAIQLNGDSRPASGAEHHLSHFWEMGRINEENPALQLHGEQVGVASLLLLDVYRQAAAAFAKPFSYHPDELFNRQRIESVYRELTDDILKENLPHGYDSSSLAKIKENAPISAAEKIRAILAALPAKEYLLAEMKACGCKTTLSELGLPETDDFRITSLHYAPYARNRLTFLKYLAAQNLIL